jgi:hypothetical protein
VHHLQETQLHDDSEQEKAVEETGGEKILQMVQNFRLA